VNDAGAFGFADFVPENDAVGVLGVARYIGDEFAALLYEFRAQIADYLQSLTKTNMRTLADLIAFNTAHCPQELVYYDQDVFLLAEQFVGYPNDPNYIAARSHATSTARAGIDNAVRSQNLDAIVAPHLTNSTGPAVAGYPNFSMPVGVRSSGRPAGMLMYSTAFHEAQLIAMAYDLEQALHPRQQPQFLNAITPIPNAGGYPGSPFFKITIAGTDRTLAATADRELVVLPAFTGAPEQLWRIDELADGTYRVMPKAVPNSKEPLALSAVGSSMPTLARFNPDSDRQRWNLKTP